MNEVNHRNNFRGEEEKPIDIHDLLNKFLRRKNLFLCIFIPIFLGVFITQFTKPYSPIYRASFDIGVSQESQVAGFFSPLSRETPTTQIGTVTQRVISNLLSVNLAYKLADTLKLYAYVKEGDSDIEVETRIKQDFKQPIGPLKLKFENGGFSMYQDGNKIQQGLFNEYVDFGSFELKVIPSPGKNLKGKTYEIIIYPRERIAIALRNSLSIKVLEANKIEQAMGSSGVPFSGEGASKKLVTAKSIFPGMNLIGILRISVLWGNPDDALKIADVLSEQIIKEDVSEKSLRYIQSKTFIDSQLTLYRENLTRLEEGVKGFKERKKIANLGASTQALINQVSDLESRKNQLQIEQKILNDMSNYLVKSEQGIDVPLNFAAALVSDPILQTFYSRLLTTEAELKGKLKEYSTGHPKVLEITARLGGLKEQMTEEVAKRTVMLKSEIASVKTQIYMLQAKLESVPDDEIQLARLERDRETVEKLYTFFAEKLEETRVAEAGVTSDVKIINPPLASSSPVNSRRPMLNFAVSVIMALMAGGFAVFIAEYVDNTAKAPEELKVKIGLPIYGSIPLAEDEKEKAEKANLGKESSIYNKIINRIVYRIKHLIEMAKNRGKRQEVDESIKILRQDVNSDEFEAFRKLSVNLDFGTPEEKYKVIYMTSPGPEEGKTFVALNLAVVLSTKGKKIMLIDTDFRKQKGHLTDVVKLKKEHGLFDILKGEATLKDTVIKFKNPSESIPLRSNEISVEEQDSSQQGRKSQSIQLHSIVEILPMGKIPPNPFVFLESDKMKDLLGKLKEKYDYVLIDGVPVLLFADATYLANFADGVLLTARYGKTNFKELENTRDILLAAKSNIIGIVMNGVPKTRGSYYYHYYHKYYSKYYKKA